MYPGTSEQAIRVSADAGVAASNDGPPLSRWFGFEVHVTTLSTLMFFSAVCVSGIDWSNA
jgi:hypothetical protein